MRSATQAAPRAFLNSLAMPEVVCEPASLRWLPVRIATWNVNSVKQRVPRLLPWLDQRAPDVVCLQETKLADDAFLELLGDELSERGYEAAVHGEATWNGVSILSRVGLVDVVPASRARPDSRHPRRGRSGHLRRDPGRVGVCARTGGCLAPSTTSTSSPGSRHYAAMVAASGPDAKRSCAAT